MKHTPTRHLRRECLTSHLHPPPTERAEKQLAYILDAAMRMFAAFGRDGMTMRNIADALDISRDTLRRRICDLDHLFALVLAGHLATLTQAIAALDTGQPDLFARRRAEFHRLTQNPFGYTARLHVLLNRERILLPEDERTPIERQLTHLAGLLGAPPTDAALILFGPPAAPDAPQPAPAQAAPHATATQAAPHTPPPPDTTAAPHAPHTPPPQPTHTQTWPPPTRPAAQNPPTPQSHPPNTHRLTARAA